MASASGVKVPTAVTEEWAKATSSTLKPPRALVLLINGESFEHHATLPASDDFKADIGTLLPSLPSRKTCASFVYRTDERSGTGYEWLLITFVPDDAGVRSKMLHASSKAGLVKSLGEGRIQRSMFFTNVSDLTPSAFSAHLAHLSAPPPLTASETALLQVKEAEAEAAREAELSGNFRGMGLGSGFGGVFGAPRPGGGRSAGGAVGDVRGGVRGGIGAMGMMAGGGGAGGGAGKKGFEFGEGVLDALKELLCGEGQEVGKAVMLQIETSTETLRVHFSGPLSPSSLKSKLPSKEPCYTFYAWPQPGSTASSASAATTESSSTGAPTKLDIPSRQQSVDPTHVELPATPIGGPSTATGEPKAAPTSTDAAEPASTSPADAPKPLDTQTPPPDEPTSSVRIGFIYTCPTGSTVKWRMMYSVNVGFVVREAEERCGVKIEKKIETSDVSDLTESHLKTELFPPLPTSGGPSKSHSTSSYGGGASSSYGGFRNFGAPARSSTLPSANASSSSSDTAGSGGAASPGGSLPDSAFSVFGPRINVGSPGAGGGFARPRPAGKR